MLGRYIVLCGMKEQFGADRDVSAKEMEKAMESSGFKQMMSKLGENNTKLKDAMLHKSPDFFMDDVSAELGKAVNAPAARKQNAPEAGGNGVEL